MRDAKKEKIEALAKKHGISFEAARVKLRESRWGKAKGVLRTAFGFIPGVGDKAKDALEASDKLAQQIKKSKKG